MPDYRLPDGTIPVLLSSDTAAGLRAEAAQLLRYLEDRPSVQPDQVADMLFRTRMPRRWRALGLISAREELLAALAAVAEGREHPAVVAGAGAATSRRVGFVFPGQGSQRPGMGKLYYELSPEYRAEVEACAELHEQKYGHAKPLHYLLGNEGRYEDTVWEVQPALMFHMVGLAAMWQAAGVRPTATIGHSQGELAAGAVSAVMTRRDAVLAVTQRSLLVERISPRGYSMAVLGMDREDVEALLARNSGWAELSVVNSPHILAISGDRSTIVELVETATARGQFAREIQVAYPAHTSIVAELRGEFEAFLGDEMSAPTFMASEIPCYGATLGAPITPDLEHEQYWYWNLRNRVRFDRAIVAAATDGIDTFIEVSEHPTLQLAVQENLTLVPSDPALPPRDFHVIGTSRRTAEGLTEFTRNLAAVAVSDLNYDWQALRAGDTVRKPLRDFPNTVMNPQRLWAAFESPAAVEIPRTDHLPARRIAENWVRLDKRSLVPPRDLLVVDHTGRCGALAAQILTAAHNHGGSARLFGDHTAGDYNSVVVLLPELPAQDGPAALDEVTAFFGDAAWLPELDGVQDCWLVTVGGETVTEDDPAPQLFHGAVTAGYRCLGMEHLGIAFRHIDLESGDASQAAALVRALHAKAEPELALRGGGVYAKRLELDTATPEPATAEDLDHVVIIGGTGTLGVEFCSYYAERGARRITLLSRSGETDAVTRRLRAVRARRTAEVAVVACDVSDAASVREAAVAQQVPASLIVHAAVNYVRAELADVTAEKVAEMASSKVIGTENMLREWPRTEDCRLVLCSSAAAAFGGRGQVLYATVNRMLDVLARRLRAEGTDAVAMQWGLWDLEGPLHAVGVEPVQAAGARPMRPADALRVGFTEHADHRGAANRLVCAADWADLQAMMAAVGYGPTLEALVAEVAAAEAAEAARVTASSGNGVAATVPAEDGVGAATGADDADASNGAGAAGPVGGATLSDQVRRQLGKVMGTDGGDGFDSSVPLVALGLDSLQALDFRKRVQAELNRDLPVAAILGGASLDDVVRLMAGSPA
ncbi:nocobactin polyketide synthase NbtC [Nocardia sp. NPDC050406]|uniref:nocobactin polyketide synthase NbtC n=1 Tax=Nocardia sp. NPDC050406 TaxID=3364318 RepID=UPI0037A74758